eukprot:scaffold1521_cov271-Chaetoceros_neogracile.AAC.2
MEHTALSNAAKALLSVLNSFDAFTGNSSFTILSVRVSKLENIITTSIEYATNIDEALLDDLSLGLVLNFIQQKAMASPYPLGRYDSSSEMVYFGLFEDHMHGKWEENQDQRGLELVQFSTRLGPTFSKFLWEDMYGLIFANICDAADTNFVNV